MTQQQDQEPQQWTQQDAGRASPQKTLAAMKAGRLKGLGVGDGRDKPGHAAR